MAGSFTDSPSFDARASSLAVLQDPIHALAHRARSLDIRGYEVGDLARVATELHPLTLGFLGEASGLLETVLTASDSALVDARAPTPGVPGLPFERAMDAAIASAPRSHRAVSEIAFVARLELTQRAKRLAQPQATQRGVSLLSECDSSLRHTRKALTAVDAAIAHVESLPPRLDFTSELQTSLAVRREYARFRARLLHVGAPTPTTLRPCFRAIGTQFAILVGRDAYPEMRVRDRLLLRELQQRVLDFLRHAEQASFTLALRLWQDITACVEMFSLINRRTELAQHDAALIQSALERLSQAEALPDAAWGALVALEGLEPDLDRVLMGDQPEPRVLAAVLRRAAHRGGGTKADPGAPW